MDPLKILKEEHRQLLSEVGELERIVTGLTNRLSPTVQEELKELLQRFIQLLSSHIEGEASNFFPNLKARLPETDHWQLAMLETQYEMLLSEAQHLHELVSGVPSSIPVDRLKEGGVHLVRWLREHVMIEEERLFPKLQGPPED